MPHRQPASVTNLDRYGYPALLWDRVLRAVGAGSAKPEATWFLGTSRSDGRPDAAGVGAAWHDGDVYFTSGPGTRKSRNLVSDPRCTISARLDGIDVVFEGTAGRVTDLAVLEALAVVYRQGGWPAEVDGDAFTAPYSAPSAGPPPWHLYRLKAHTVIAVATEEPYGATRWRFAA